MDDDDEASARRTAGALYRYLETADRPNIGQMHRLVRGGADVNFAGPYGYTPLHVLMRCSPVGAEEVRFMLAAGANVNAASLCGFTALHTYMCFGTVTPDTLRALLHGGVRVRDLERNIPAVMEYFDRQGMLGTEVEVVRLLVDAGADIGAKDDVGRTPLHVYLSGFFVVEPVVRALIALGADANAKDAYGRTPLFAFLKSRNVDVCVLRALVDAGACVTEKDLIRRTALHYHCESFKTRACVFRELIAAGCDPRGADILHNTVLHSLAIGSSCRASQLAPLLEAGVSVNARNVRMQTPLHIAAAFNLCACVRLMRAGADASLCDLDEVTPFLSMVRHNCVPAVRAAMPSVPDSLLAGTVNRLNVLVPTDATRECVMELALRRAVDLLSDAAIAAHAQIIALCAEEISHMCATRLGEPQVALVQILVEREPFTVITAKAARRATARVRVYHRALSRRMEEVRRRSALVQRMVRAVSPCSLPPEVLSRIFLYVPVDDLMVMLRISSN
ncbi:Ank protein Ank1 [Bovine papular stomatitis virus]